MNIAINTNSNTDPSNPNFPMELLTDFNTMTDKDKRNLIDHYKYWTVDAVRAELDKKRTPLVIIAENLSSDYNTGSIIRSCNAFAGQKVIIAGRRRWDRRGAVGTHNYENLEYVEGVENLRELYQGLKADGYTLVTFDNIEGASDIREFDWPEKTALILGQESIGVSPIAIEEADNLVFIPQFGSTRSLNVASAGSIAMYAYMCANPQLY